MRFTSLLRDRRGNLLIETALLMPVILVLLMGGFEVVRFVLLYNKVNRAIAQVDDIVSRLGMGHGAPVTVCKTLMDDIFGSVDDIMNPYGASSYVHMTMTGVSNDGSGSKVLWQYNKNGGGSYSDVSSSGTAGSSASFPSGSGFSLAANQTVVITEMTYNYYPIVFNHASGMFSWISSRNIKQAVIMSPRAAYVDHINTGC